MTYYLPAVLDWIEARHGTQFHRVGEEERRQHFPSAPQSACKLRL
jgi:hypothetical protein